MGIWGSGLAKGLAVTLRTMGKRSVTSQYPDVKLELPPRSRGVIARLEENCTVCMLCARVPRLHHANFKPLKRERSPFEDRHAAIVIRCPELDQSEP